MDSHMNVSCFRSSTIIAVLYLYGWSMLWSRIVILGEHLVTDVSCTSSKVDPLFPLFLLTTQYASIGSRRHLGNLKLEDDVIHFWRLVVRNPGHWYLTGFHTIFLVIFMCECVFTCEWMQFLFFFYDYECVYAVNLLFLVFLSTTQPSDGEVQMIVIALCQPARYIHHEPGHTHGRKQGSLLHKESRVQFVLQSLYSYSRYSAQNWPKKETNFTPYFGHGCCSFGSKREKGSSFFCLVFFFLVRRKWWSDLSTHFELFIRCHSPHWLLICERVNVHIGLVARSSPLLGPRISIICFAFTLKAKKKNFKIFFFLQKKDSNCLCFKDASLAVTHAPSPPPTPIVRRLLSEIDTRSAM